MDYSAVITGTSNVIVTLYDGTFGNCNPGESCVITNSLSIYNSGNANPLSGINATFTTNVSGVAGMNYTTNVINGTLFQLNQTALTADGNGTTIMLNESLGALANRTIDANLTVPAGQTAGTYTGTVRISWIA